MFVIVSEAKRLPWDREAGPIRRKTLRSLCGLGMTPIYGRRAMGSDRSAPIAGSIRQAGRSELREQDAQVGLIGVAVAVDVAARADAVPRQQDAQVDL
jgi:hypothetical protein